MTTALTALIRDFQPQVQYLQSTAAPVQQQYLSTVRVISGYKVDDHLYPYSLWPKQLF